MIEVFHLPTDQLEITNDLRVAIKEAVIGISSPEDELSPFSVDDIHVQFVPCMTGVYEPAVGIRLRITGLSSQIIPDPDDKNRAAQAVVGVVKELFGQKTKVACLVIPHESWNGFWTTDFE